MQKTCRAIFAVLPYLAMIPALVTLIISLFYNFHNDTVPLISIMISVAFSLFCVLLCIGAGICIVRYLKTDVFSRQLLRIGAVCLLNLVFAAVCLLNHADQFKVIAVYFLITTLLYAVSLLFCRTMK